MIQITKYEAMRIRELFPNANIYIANKKKKRRNKSYFMTEESNLIEKLKEIRSESAKG